MLGNLEYLYFLATGKGKMENKGILRIRTDINLNNADLAILQTAPSMPKLLPKSTLSIYKRNSIALKESGILMSADSPKPKEAPLPKLVKDPRFLQMKKSFLSSMQKQNSRNIIKFK
jgi:hypothetical protein